MMKIHITHTSFIAVFFLSAKLLPGQTNVSLNEAVSKKEILIGEQLQFTLKIENLRRGNFFTPEIDIPDSLEAFEVLQRGIQDSLITGQFISYRRSFIITSFDSGLQTIPSVRVQLDPVNGSKKTRPTFLNSEPVSVLVSFDTTEAALHDIKDIIEVEGSRTTFWYFYLAAAFLLAGTLMYFIWSKKKKTGGEIKPVPSIPPLEEALGALKELKQRDLKNPADVKLWFSDLFNIARVFVSKKSGRSFSHLTSDELSVELKSKFSDHSDFNRYLQVLRMTDAVKFAKFIPAEEARSEALLVTEKIIKVLDNIYV